MLFLVFCCPDPTKQFLNVHVQCTSYIANDLNCDVSLAPFDTANVRPVTASSSRKLLLCPASSLPQITNTSPELFLNVRHWDGVSVKEATRNRDYEYHSVHMTIKGNGRHPKTTHC